MLSLLQSDQFQQEYKQYQEKISKITDIETKKNAEALVKKLVAEIRAIDNQHTDMFNQKQPSNRLAESRTRIADIRKQLNKIFNIGHIPQTR
jgi:hypothetical protein